ncbi:antitoxin Xre/MbcA/ParS toxin-binding domain-containing protein [Pseudomonas vanderleydeniana]|nr:antitoxin Xre/MbcA/ParS toxin-binding domain-containing protein [Pseudomonas vanderleydeniana]
MLVQARRAVLKSGDWLTAAEVALLVGLNTRYPSAQPNKWKQQGLIFAISHRGVDYFPGYGLDPDADFLPAQALAKIIEVFAGHKDCWGMASWLHSDNSMLGGKRPQELLTSAPDRVIAAALDEVQEIAHG